MICTIEFNVEPYIKYRRQKFNTIITIIDEREYRIISTNIYIYSHMGTVHVLSFRRLNTISNIEIYHVLDFKKLKSELSQKEVEHMYNSNIYLGQSYT